MKAGVLVISNDRSTFDFIKQHMVLLRNNDMVYESDYNDAERVIVKNSPELVILHCGYDLHSFSQLLKKITIPVIALFDEMDSEYLLTACDCGVSDFITRKSSSAEILARVMFLLKNKNSKNKLADTLSILQEKGVIDNNGFYTNPFEIFPYYLNKFEYGSLLLISGDKELGEALKSQLRENDVIASRSANLYYVFMPYTDIDGAVSVVRKLGGAEIPPKVRAGICSHYGKKEFGVLNNILENALSVAVGTNKEYIIIDENLAPNANWLEKMNSGKKNFKLFKQEFNKMLELVLTPVFYQMQTKYEASFMNTRIFQRITPEVSVFKIQGEYFDSEFKLKSSGFSAITIDITHNTDEKRITIDLNDLESKTLEVLLEEFVAEHRVYMEEIC